MARGTSEEICWAKATKTVSDSYLKSLTMRRRQLMDQFPDRMKTKIPVPNLLHWTKIQLHSHIRIFNTVSTIQIILMKKLLNMVIFCMIYPKWQKKKYYRPIILLYSTLPSNYVDFRTASPKEFCMAGFVLVLASLQGLSFLLIRVKTSCYQADETNSICQI